MKLLQVTDPHVPPAGRKIYGVDARERLDQCVADINRHHADADLCLLTGDLVNHGDEAEYANLKGALDALTVPFKLMVGNHDDRALVRRFFPQATDVDEDGHIQSAIDVAEGRILLLDTNDPGKSSGTLCERRLAWLDRRLAEKPDSPLYIFLHHPPLAVGIEYMDAIGLRNGEELWAHLAPHARRIRLIAFGHLHRPVSGLWHGVPFAGCPSTVHQVALELGPQAERHLNFNLEPPCYAIFQIGAENVVIHQQRFTENWKTFPRAGKPGM
jgi:3',5'-cyclic AMP phosphodiesterase CpdA